MGVVTTPSSASSITTAMEGVCCPAPGGGGGGGDVPRPISERDEYGRLSSPHGVLRECYMFIVILIIP